MNPNEFLPEDLLRKIVEDPKLRRNLSRQSHWYFFNIYFAEYLEYPTAPFQLKMFEYTEDDALKLAVIAAFRNSGKSTIIGTSLPIWAIIGRLQKKHVLVISKTQTQVAQHARNIRRELEHNHLLKKELGPFKTTEDRWGNMILTIPRYGAQIVAASREQSIRGMRHGHHRPDLIIVDDVEDLESVKTAESRQKTYDWFDGEVIPAGDERTKVFVLGNILHEDSTTSRLDKEIREGTRPGKSLIVPIVDPDGNIAWPGRFSDMAAIEALRKTVNERAWQQEFMQNTIADDAQVIRPQWLLSYTRTPRDMSKYKRTIIGIDPAISQLESADNTGMVAAHVFGAGDTLEIYIEPAPINQKLTLYQLVEEAGRLYHRVKKEGWDSEICIEGGGYQKAAREALLRAGLPAKEVTTEGKDKRARLYGVAHLVESGKVYLPERGAEALKGQLVGFPGARYDDLLDAFVICLKEAMESPSYGIKVVKMSSLVERRRGRTFIDEVLKRRGIRSDFWG